MTSGVLSAVCGSEQSPTPANAAFGNGIPPGRHRWRAIPESPVTAIHTCESGTCAGVGMFIDVSRDRRMALCAHLCRGRSLSVPLCLCVLNFSVPSGRCEFHHGLMSSCETTRVVRKCEPIRPEWRQVNEICGVHPPTPSERYAYR